MDGSMRATAGGFQAMTQDVLTVLNDIPFSIPPYFALLGRAVVTLEGIALTGDPNYKIVMEASILVVAMAVQGRFQEFHCAVCLRDDFSFFTVLTFSVYLSRLRPPGLSLCGAQAFGRGQAGDSKGLAGGRHLPSSKGNARFMQASQVSSPRSLLLFCEPAALLN